MKFLKRNWVYAMKPQVYGISCDKCGGHNITWSEYRNMIWCYDCKMDIYGNEGIFDGPIPLEVCNLLGISFNRIDLKTKQIKKMTSTKTGKLIWRFEKKVSK